MDYSLLEKSTFNELAKTAKEMGLPIKRSKNEYIADIQNAFREYEKYKSHKIDKYTKIRQLGNKGKEGTTYLVVNHKNKEFAMKTFRRTKSSNTLKTEYALQKQAATVGVAPRVVEYDSVSKYIVMEKMESHLIDIIKKQKNTLTKSQQMQIIELYQKLDAAGIFHADSNILNYMMIGPRIYLIDYGFAKEINSKLTRKLNTQTPNLKLMTIGFVLKLKELQCDPKSWKYLRKFISTSDQEKYGLIN